MPNPLLPHRQLYNGFERHTSKAHEREPQTRTQRSPEKPRQVAGWWWAPPCKSICRNVHLAEKAAVQLAVEAIGVRCCAKDMYFIFEPAYMLSKFTLKFDGPNFVVEGHNGVVREPEVADVMEKVGGQLAY